MKSGELSGKVVRLPMEEIHPYPGNPRVITDEAVDAVEDSIRRYGYQQPVVVDKDHVVIVGHTRLEALRRLGAASALVLVTDLDEKAAAEYRLVDNRTGELAEWNEDSLAIELREFDEDLLDEYFPDADLEIQTIEEAQVSNEDVKDAQERLENRKGLPDPPSVKIECPACHGVFEVFADTLPGATKDLLRAMKK